jgi:hypothetical protein
LKGMGQEAFEMLTAGVLCTIIAVATTIWVASMQPIQETVVSEAKEADLIRAIYIDEYARNFIRYGMKFILETSTEELAALGGIIPSQATRKGTRIWVNITGGVMKPPEFTFSTKEAIPFDGEGIMFYRWCNDTNAADCGLTTIKDVSTAEDREAAVEQSLNGAFSLTEYVTDFAKYAQLYPQISYGNETISIDEGKVSATGEFRVVVRVRGFAGVNSSEIITTSIDSDIIEKMEAAVDFVQTGGDLDTALQATDPCTLRTEEEVQKFNNTLPTNVGGYSHWIEFLQPPNIIVSGTNACLDMEVVHHLDDLRFKTELYYCKTNC